MRELLTFDLGPTFYGFQGKVDGKPVCIATPEVECDPVIRRLVYDLFQRRGGDCASCLNCPIGRVN